MANKLAFLLFLVLFISILQGEITYTNSKISSLETEKNRLSISNENTSDHIPKIGNDKNETHDAYLLTGEQDIIIQELSFINVKTSLPAMIKLVDCTNITIQNNIFQSFQLNGIIIENSENIAITNNIFTEIGEIVISIDSSSGIKFLNNSITNSLQLFSSFGLENSLIRNNTISTVDTGFGLFHSYNISVENNILENINPQENLVPWGAIEVKSDRGNIHIINNTINTIRNIWAISVSNTGNQEIVISNNSITNSNDIAIYVSLVRSVVIQGNIIENVERGIEIDDLITRQPDEDLQIITIAHNQIKKYQERGILITMLNNVIIENNSISNSSYDEPAIFMVASRNISVVENKIENLKNAIYVGNSETTIANNTITHVTKLTISVFNTQNKVIISENHFENLEGIVLRVDKSKEVTIQENKFNTITGTILYVNVGSYVNFKDNTVNNLNGNVIEERLLGFNTIKNSDNSVDSKNYKYHNINIGEIVLLVIVFICLVLFIRKRRTNRSSNDDPNKSIEHQ